MAEPDTTITDAEWHLLEALGALDRATARQVADELHDAQQWAYSTVKTMLDRMTAKGLVSARQVGNVWEFTASVKPDDARRSAWKRFVSSAFGGAVAPALAFIASEARLTKKQREALLSMLEEQERPS